MWFTQRQFAVNFGVFSHHSAQMEPQLSASEFNFIEIVLFIPQKDLDQNIWFVKESPCPFTCKALWLL